MLILALDTTTKYCSVALLRDETVVHCIAGVTEEPYASRVFSDVERVLGHAGVELPQIELFAVAAGPGSFTGLRVGLTAVKGWAEAFARQVAPVSALEAIAMQATDGSNLIAALVDARGRQVFGGLFGRSTEGEVLRIIGEEVVMPPSDYLDWVAQEAGERSPVFATTSPDVARATLQGSRYSDATLETVSPELAPWIGRLGLARSRRGAVVDALALEANYVRRSDAEVKWKGG